MVKCDMCKKQIIEEEVCVYDLKNFPNDVNVPLKRCLGFLFNVKNKKDLDNLNFKKNLCGECTKNIEVFFHFCVKNFPMTFYFGE
jgi:hypothetical protein